MKAFYVLTLLFITTTINAQNYWEYVGDSALSTAVTLRTEIEGALDGSIYVLHEESSTGVSVKKYNGTNWQPLGLTGINGDYQYGRIEIFPPSTPYLFANNANDGTSYVMEYNGTAWDTVGGAVHGQITGNMDLKFHQGTPYVVFGDNTSSGYPSVKKLNGANWEYIGAAGYPNITCYDTEIFFYQDTLYTIYETSFGRAYNP